MSLALGLAAVDEYFREGDRRELRDRDRKRFGWESQRSDAEMSVLGDKTEADRLSYRDRAGESGARMATRPQRTANEIQRLGQESYSLSRAGQRQTKVEDTADAKVDYGFGDAKFNLSQQPTVQETASNTNKVGLQNSASALENTPARLETETNRTTLGLRQSEADLAAQPAKIATAAAQGTVSQMTAQGQLVSGLYDALQAGNSDIVRTYIQNSINTGLFPSLKGKTVAEVGSMKDAKGQPVVVAKDAAGQTIFQMSLDEMKRVREAMDKGQVLNVNDGNTVVQVKGGKATPLYTAPTSAAKAAERMGPLERDVGYLVRAHKMTPDQALSHLNSSKTMSREQFVLKSVQDSIAVGTRPTEAQVAEFGAMYDRATKGGPRVAQPGAAGPGAPTARPAVDPALSRLLGIPQ
jgi:hypothetical protein